MSVTRNHGTPINGTAYMAGGGYGASTDLDDMAQRAGEGLSRLFGIDAEVRFNSDGRSGGAWLKTPGPGLLAASHVGIRVGTYTSHAEARKLYGENGRYPDREWLDGMLSDPDGGIYVQIMAQEEYLLDPSEANTTGLSGRQWTTDVESVEAGLDLLRAHVVIP